MNWNFWKILWFIVVVVKKVKIFFFDLSWIKCREGKYFYFHHSTTTKIKNLNCIVIQHDEESNQNHRGRIEWQEMQKRKCHPIAKWSLWHVWSTFFFTFAYYFTVLISLLLVNWKCLEFHFQLDCVCSSPTSREKVRTRAANCSIFDRLVSLRTIVLWSKSFVYIKQMLNQFWSGAVFPLFFFSLFAPFFVRLLASLSCWNEYFRFWFKFGGKSCGWNVRITIEEQ